MADAQILSQYLCTGLAEWWKQNTYFGDTFQGIWDYLRVDTPLTETTSVCIYFADSPSLEQNQWNEVGKLAVDVTFNLKEKRDVRAAQIIGTLEMIRGQLLTNPVYAQQFISAGYVPGLIKFGTRTNFANLRDLKAKIMNPKNSTLVITFTINYEISVLLNQRAAWKNNKDYYSPTVDIYHEVNGIREVVLEDTI